MSTFARQLAEITQHDWDAHRGEVARVSGENGRMASALQLNTNQMVRLTTAVDKLERRMGKTERRIESHEDLEDEAKMARLMADNKRLRSLPAKAAKWLGWAIATALAATELYRALH